MIIRTSEKYKKLFFQEKLILDVTEVICEIMQEKHITNLQLAQRIGRSERWVKKLLDGGVNVKIRMLSDIGEAI